MNIREFAEALLRLPEEWLELSQEDLSIARLRGNLVLAHSSMPPVINEFDGEGWKYIEFQNQN